MAVFCAIVALFAFLLRAYSDDAFLSLATTFLGVLLGGLVNMYFARRGSEELRREAENLRKLNGLTLMILDEAKFLPDNVEPTKDDAGNYTGGLTYKGTAGARGRSAAGGSVAVPRNEAADSEDQEAAEADTPGQQG